MKLSPFGATIARIEAERKAEAQAAIAAGWTEADHPEKCCPPDKSTPQPKRAGRSLEEVERLRKAAANKAKWWSDAAKRTQLAIDHADAENPKFDHGMMQLSLKVRQRGMSTELRRSRDLEYQNERRKHFERLAEKYQAQIEKRKS